MINKKLLATEAIAKALQVRRRLNISLEASVCPLDAAEKLGIDVRLMDIPSMEGIYVAGNAPKIMLSSLRPQARRSFTCGHELGHHIFGHGEQFDELVGEKSESRADDPNEFTADCFSGYFLMPKVTIESGMKRRGLAYSSITPVQVYALASWLGVGYSTLINHLTYALNAISRSKAQELQKIEPRHIREQLLGQSVPSQLHLADPHWVGRTVDCAVGDYLMLSAGIAIEGEQITVVKRESTFILAQATAPGIARITESRSEWAAFVRISPKDYTGRSCYRFEEEVE
jgi:Zn-dependent peptidase ImmA (M78 family)